MIFDGVAWLFKISKGACEMEKKLKFHLLLCAFHSSKLNFTIMIAAVGTFVSLLIHYLNPQFSIIEKAATEESRQPSFIRYTGSIYSGFFLLMDTGSTITNMNEMSVPKIVNTNKRSIYHKFIF